MQKQDITVETFTNGAEAAMGADIITTATSDKVMANIVSDNMVFQGVHINAIGGGLSGQNRASKGSAIARRCFCRTCRTD
jgi:ornithine cyclodeaminase/alanine dehydrogenase-like protein (mu-crystallin family)